MSNEVSNYNKVFEGFALFPDNRALPGDVIQRIIHYIATDQKAFVSLARTCKVNWNILSKTDEYFNLKIPRVILFHKETFASESGRARYQKLAAIPFATQPSLSVCPLRFSKETQFSVSDGRIHAFDGQKYTVFDLKGNPLLEREVFTQPTDAAGGFSLLTDTLIRITTGQGQSYFYHSLNEVIYSQFGRCVGFDPSSGCVAIRNLDEVVDAITGNLLLQNIENFSVGRNCLYCSGWNNAAFAFSNGAMKGPIFLQIPLQIPEIVKKIGYFSDKFVALSTFNDKDKSLEVFCCNSQGELLFNRTLISLFEPDDYYVHGDSIIFTRNCYNGSNPVWGFSLKTGEPLKMTLPLHSRTSALAKWILDTYDNVRTKPVIRTILNKAWDLFHTQVPLPLNFSTFKCLGVADGKIAIAEQVTTPQGSEYQVVKIYDFTNVPPPM